MIEQGLAAITLVVCALLLVRLLLGPARRQRVDAALQRTARAARRRLHRLWHWRAARREAAAAAEEAIARARRAVERDGNVVRPEAFRQPRKPH